MGLPFIREFRLAKGPGDGLYPYVDTRGAYIGNSVPLLEKALDSRWQPRRRRQLDWLLSKGYGRPFELGWRLDGLACVARALNKGDLSLAKIALVHCEMPALPGVGAARRMSEAEAMLTKYNPDWSDEPRVDAGLAGAGEWMGEAESVLGAPPAPRESNVRRAPFLAEDCAQEWARARIYCMDLMLNGFAGGNARNVFGPSYWSCVMGQVSQRCGGHAIG